MILSFIQCWIYLSMFRDIDNYGKYLAFISAFFVESNLRRKSYYQFWIYTHYWNISIFFHCVLKCCCCNAETKISSFSIRVYIDCVLRPTCPAWHVFCSFHWDFVFGVHHLRLSFICLRIHMPNFMCACELYRLHSPKMPLKKDSGNS